MFFPGIDSGVTNSPSHCSHGLCHLSRAKSSSRGRAARASCYVLRWTTPSAGALGTGTAPSSQLGVFPWFNDLKKQKELASLHIFTFLFAFLLLISA